MCEYCDFIDGSYSSKSLINDRFVNVNIIKINNQKQVSIRICNDYDITEIEINFCPMCGKKLEV